MATPKENISFGFSWVVGKLNELFALIPTKTSDLTNDGEDTFSPFVQQDGLKTVNGNSLIGSGNLVINGQSVIPDYTDIDDMLTNQVNQSNEGSYLVMDASDDPNITFASGETKLQAEYRFNGTATGSIDDYTLISAPYGNHTVNTNPLVTPDTGTEITLYPFGNFCNSETANTEDTIAVVYTNDLNPAGEWAKLLIDTTGKADFPTIGTDIRLLNGDTFEEGEKFIAKIYHDGFALCLQYVKIISDASTDFSLSLLFITSPTPRTEVDGTALNPTCIAEDADSVEFFYKNLSNTWVSIDDAVNTSGDIWEIASWTPTVPALAIKAVATYSDTTTQEVENLLFSISIYDTFTGTNGTNITSHTPDVNLGATAWTVVSGDWQIQSNALEIVTGGTSIHAVYHDLGYKDAIFKFKPTVTATIQVVLRYEDDNNFLLLCYNVSTTTTTVFQKIAGVNTSIFSDATGIMASGNDIELWLIDEELKIIVNNLVKAFVPIPTPTAYTKFGFRRGAAASSTKYDNVTIIPIAPQPIDSTVGYSISQSGLPLITTGFNTPKDDNAIGDFDLAVVGSTNYLLYSAAATPGVFGGLCLATSPVSDPHNWTVQTDYALEISGAAGCGIWHDGTTWYVVYTDRAVGALRYATGTDLGDLTDQGVIKDITGTGIYIRQSSIIVEDGIWYVFSDLRYDQPSGEFGYIGVVSGSSLETLGDYTEVLTNVSYKDDTCNLTGVSVKKNESNGHYEMFYAGYKGRPSSGSGFVHTVWLATSKTIKGKYKRVSTTALIAPAGSFGDKNNGAPCRIPNTDFLYYHYNDSVEGSGLTYGTLTET